jgi:hypothetical protein
MAQMSADRHAALGLDPGLGFIHLDTAARDSLACDLMDLVILSARPAWDVQMLRGGQEQNRQSV